MMNFEKQLTVDTINNKTDLLAGGFRELARENNDASVFEELEIQLEQSGFGVADTSDVSAVLHNSSLFCRSENFSKVMELVLYKNPIKIQNETEHANMCIMSSSEGYRTAMSEGFSGKDVNHALKTVISFEGIHLSKHAAIPAESDLWKLKPKTAAVSVAGAGMIQAEDVKMISFRFPIHLYPEKFLTESEKDMLEEKGLGFVVRHYTQKETAH